MIVVLGPNHCLSASQHHVMQLNGMLVVAELLVSELSSCTNAYATPQHHAIHIQQYPCTVVLTQLQFDDSSKPSRSRT